VTAHQKIEAGGARVRRPFPDKTSLAHADPFLLLDHMGQHMNAPEEAKDAPWHPHRRSEAVTDVLDGEIAHHDTNGATSARAARSV
jgi:redox-sensitive bicupin YhaK (pirin superfamily)